MIRPEAHEVIRTVGALGLVSVAGLGAYLVINRAKLFGASPELSHETSGARSYSNTHIFLVWLGLMKLFAFLTFCG